MHNVIYVDFVHFLPRNTEAVLPLAECVTTVIERARSVNVVGTGGPDGVETLLRCVETFVAFFTAKVAFDVVVDIAGGFLEGLETRLLREGVLLLGGACVDGETTAFLAGRRH